MWVKLAKFILKYRLLLISIVGLITLFMAYNATNIRLNYALPKLLPKTHPITKEYEAFRQQYGEDGNLLVIGFKTDDLFNRDLFNDLYTLGNEVKQVEGVEGVISIAHAANVVKNAEEKKFEMLPLIQKPVATQAEMDSVKAKFLALPFYRNLLYNPETNASLLGITLNNELLNSKKRIAVVEGLMEQTKVLGEKHNMELHYSGMPFIRTFQVTKISEELSTFLLLASAFIALLLFLLFRSLATVFYPMLVVGISVIWAVGTITLFGFQVSVLTGLIPTLIVVIGIPNCVYLLNKYNEEFRKHGSRETALVSMISRIGYVTFFANLTTAIGFGVFALMKSELLKEFGLVAGLNICGTYVISMIVIPVIFSYIREPKERHLNYLERPFFKKILKSLTKWTFQYRTGIQILAGIIFIASLFGISKLKSEGYLFDDVKPEAKSYQDLKFFERNFGGVMPMDILVDTKKKGGVTKLRFMQKLKRVHAVIEADTSFSRPLSLIDGVNFATQAYFNGKEKFYDLPSDLEANFILRYLKNSGNANNDLLKTLTDSTQRVARISVTMPDVGSSAFPIIIDSLRPKIASILDTNRYDVTYTGTTLIALAGYDYLVRGLVNSVLLAFLLIAIVVGFLFRSPKMLFIALLPNIIPLASTAALMGYFGIALKPSTVLIFSVAFGISVDFTIHFLAKYRQELYESKKTVREAISTSIEETGFSMIFTFIVLFAGFIVFTWSEFTGTYYLGMLTSITLVVALLANLVLLPSIILSVDQWLSKKKT